MAKTATELKNAAIVVRDETAISANTANRIGTLFYDVVELIESIQTTTTSNASMLTSLSNAIGTLYSSVNTLQSSLTQLQSQVNNFSNLGISIDIFNDVLTIANKEYKLQEKGSELYRGHATGADGLIGSDYIGLWILYPNVGFADTDAKQYLLVTSDAVGNCYQFAFTGIVPSTTVTPSGAMIKTRSYSYSLNQWSEWRTMSGEEYYDLKQKINLAEQDLKTYNVKVDTAVLNKTVSPSTPTE